MGITFIKLVGGLGALWAATKMALEWTGKMNLVRESVSESAAWAVQLYAVLSAPSQPSTLLILSVSVGLFGLLVCFDNRRSRIFQYSSRNGLAKNQNESSEKDKLTAQIAGNRAINHQRLQEEWESLDERDREVSREIVLKGGLMESDITALLKARGFIPYEALYEPIADRVSFIQCDYTGYHSLVLVCQPWLSKKIQEEFKDDTFLNEIR